MTLYHSLPRITTHVVDSASPYRLHPYSTSSSPSSSSSSSSTALAQPVLNPAYYSAHHHHHHHHHHHQHPHTHPLSTPSTMLPSTTTTTPTAITTATAMLSTATSTSATAITSSLSSSASNISRTTSISIPLKKVKEEVWPEAVERAFMEAIAEIPKLGRRKVPLHEKHYGRNELIAAYIYKETKQSRTRKQVSSHIQVLKNTRKEDLILMELLSDGSPDESNDPAWLEAAMVKIRKIFGEDRLQDSPSSPTSPLSPSDTLQDSFEPHMEKRRSFDEDEEWRPQHNRQLSIASILNPAPEQDQAAAASVASPSATAEGSKSGGGFSQTGTVVGGDGLYSSSNAGYLRDEPYPHPHSRDFERIRSSQDPSWRERQPSQHGTSLYMEPSAHAPSLVGGMYSPRAVDHDGVQPPGHEGYDPAMSYRSERHLFWPCHFKLIQEENRVYETNSLPQLLNRESVLVEHAAPFHDSLQSEDIRVLDDTRFPRLREAFAHKRCLFMRCKMGLNLEDFSRQARLLSKNLFQSRQRLTIRCDTTVYSFGKEVVGSVETKQAIYHRDRFMYDFRIVDAWLEEFLRTLRGGGKEEMESSLQNMTIVQEFSSLVAGPEGPEGEPRSEPLLVVAYEFFAGHGNLNTYRLTSGPPPASVRARSHTWDHPTSPWAGTPAGPIQGPWTASDDSNHGNNRRAHKRPSLEFEQEWPPQPKKYRREFRPAFTFT